MTSEMNILLEKLQEAIDAAISDSGRINGIVDQMKQSGYDVCLIVESSAAVSPIEGPQPPLPDVCLSSTGELEMTQDDLAFLQELKIAA